jgi:hypothetical protein
MPEPPIEAKGSDRCRELSLEGGRGQGIDFENRLNLGAQGDVGPGTRRQRPLPPRVVPTGGDPRNLAQGGGPMG